MQRHALLVVNRVPFNFSVLCEKHCKGNYIIAPSEREAWFTDTPSGPFGRCG
jgi:hypothetical protein